MAVCHVVLETFGPASECAPFFPFKRVRKEAGGGRDAKRKNHHRPFPSKIAGEGQARCLAERLAGGGSLHSGRFGI
jgi:hypothetical protein